MKFKPTDKEGVFKSLFAAYAVLLLHVFLVAGVGVSVVLFKGVYQYLPWILSGIALFIIALFWIFYLRIKRSSTDIKDVLAHPAFQDRNVEIKLLGGVATFKISAPQVPLIQGAGENIKLLEAGEQHKHGIYQPQKLNSGRELNLDRELNSGKDKEEYYHAPRGDEYSETHIEKRLSELANLYKKGLINDEEYDLAKKRILF